MRKLKLMELLVLGEKEKNAQCQKTTRVHFSVPDSEPNCFVISYKFGKSGETLRRCAVPFLASSNQFAI